MLWSNFICTNDITFHLLFSLPSYIAGVASLCATIDQLDSCLDSLEQKNDSLQAKMKAFLNSMNEENSEEEKVTPEVDKKTTKDK